MRWEKDSWVRVLLQESFIYYKGKKEINEVVTLLRILQEFVFTPPSIQWDEIISLKISSLVSGSFHFGNFIFFVHILVTLNKVEVVFKLIKER